MTRHARIAIIGGGIAGCSTLYHLAEEGQSDAVLLERDELTSGTTWHSAAQVTNFGTNQTMIGLKSHSIRLYGELASDPEFPVGYHYGDGGIRLASTSDHMDGYAHFASMAKDMGVEFEVIGPEECAKRHPLLARNGLAGGLWDPHDGDIDPSQLCHALARRARSAGASVLQGVEAQRISRSRSKEWIIETSGGQVVCETLVIAAGYRVNEVASMIGVSLPVVSMEHQYLITEPIPEIAQAGRRLPLIRCPADDFYCRQEKQGLLVGFYEQDCRLWGMDGIDPAFTKALCPDDLERIADCMDGALERIPALRSAGIQSVVNGPITYSADGLPLVGPVPGRTNAYCIVGLRAGVGEGGGHGWLLAQQIVHGEAVYDTWCIDPRRFGSHVDTKHCALKAVEDYRNEFRFHMPHEHRPAGRRARCTAMTSEMERRRAELVPLNGWERADYFKPDSAFEERLSFRHSNAHSAVGDEVANVRSNVGMTEISGFTRIEIDGRDAANWLGRLSCSRIPEREGRVSLCYFLNRHGNVKCEATIARIGRKYWYLAAAAAEVHDFDWLSGFLPGDGSIRIRNATSERHAIVLAGPRSREALSSATDDDVSTGSLRLRDAKRIRLGAAPATVYCLSYSGELAFELHVRNEALLPAWRALEAAGERHGIRPFGMRAAESMRIEKGYRHWKAELTTEHGPAEARLMRFVHLGKNFVGKDSLERNLASKPRRRLVTLTIDCDAASPQPGDCILEAGKPVGTVTSAAYGFRTGINLALAYVDTAAAVIGTELNVEFIGERFPARVIPDCPYDPDGLRMRQ